MLSRYLRCYMLNVSVCCMFVCVVSLSQMLCVECLCVLSRYLRCYVLNVCVWYLRCYMLNVCVCCLVISDVIC